MFGFVRHLHPVSRRLHRPGSRGRRPLRLEELESRALLTTYAPSQLLHAYGFDNLPYDGTGQTIPIVDPYDNPNVPSDLPTFDSPSCLPDPALTTPQPHRKPHPDPPSR